MVYAHVDELEEVLPGADAAGALYLDLVAHGLALGALGTALASVVTGFLGLKWWQMPIAVGGLMLLVSGPAMEQLIDSVNFTDQESLNYFHRTLRSRGVIDALRAAGAKEGDSVVIGDMEFDFVE